jgi:hypothetical protein
MLVMKRSNEDRINKCAVFSDSVSCCYRCAGILTDIAGPKHFPVNLLEFMIKDAMEHWERGFSNVPDKKVCSLTSTTMPLSFSGNGMVKKNNANTVGIIAMLLG